MGPLATVTGSSIVESSASVTADNVRENGLTVSGKFKVPLSGSNAATSKVNSLSIPAPGQLDLTNNKLIVVGGDVGSFNGSAYSGITGLIQSGYHGGLWNGSGIISSAATSRTSLGVARAEDVGMAGGTFGGQPVSAGDVLVAYTLSGDANLDGAVDFLDLAKLAQAYNTTGTSWPRGDFNFDGATDFLDLAKLAQNYNTALPAGAAIDGAPAGFERDLAAAFALAPEPGSGVLALLVVGLAWGRDGSRRR
jgi:hypothetical protein